MTRSQLIKSFELWEERRVRFRKNWMKYKKANSKSPRRAYWFGRYKAAKRVVIRRRKQIMKSSPGVSSKGIALIKKFEGFRSRPYRDAVGVWTIGYGETNGVGPNTGPISEKAAARALNRRVNLDFFPAIRKLPTFKFSNQNQIDALASFIYNVGPGGIGPNTGIGRALRQKQFRKAADELLKWDKAGNIRLPGLTRRRREERELFLR